MLSPHRVMHPPQGRGTAQHLHHHNHRLNVHRSQGTVIGTNSVNGGSIAPGSIDGTQDVIAGTITATSIAAGGITANTIAVGAITANSLAVGSVTAQAIAAGAISAYVFAGNSITLAASGTASSKVLLDQTGIRMYDASGVLQNTFYASTGSITVNSGTITGAVVQTSAGSTSKVVLNNSGLYAYDSIGNNTFKVDTSGNLNATKGTITGATIQTSAASTGKVMMDGSGLRAYDAIGNQTVTIDTTGNLTMLRGTLTLSGSVPAGTNARITLDPTGIKAWNATNTQTFLLDATTGLIQCTGVLAAQGGSNIPAGVITGSLPGSANRYSDSSFQNGSGVFDFSSWTVHNAVASSGGTNVPPVYGQLTCQITASGVAAPGAPGLTLVASAGNLGVGLYRYVVTYLTGTGQETAFATTNESSITTTTTSTQVTVNLPIGPAGVTQRRVYRTVVGGASGTEKLVATIANNTAATYTDNVADASLGAAIPTVNTTQNFVSVHSSTAVDPYKRVMPGLNYSFSHYIWPYTAARQARIDINWYDINGTFISTTTGPTITPVAGQWNRVTATAMCPANAAYSYGLHYIGVNAIAGDVSYIDGFQMEQGDVPSAWAPRPDEILYASINAQMINVAQLNAISADLGTITAGTLNSVFINSGQITSGTITSTTIGGGTITGSLIQTSSGNPRVQIAGNGLSVTDSTGASIIGLDTITGLSLTAGQASNVLNSVDWFSGSPGNGYAKGTIFTNVGYPTSTATTMGLTAAAPADVNLGTGVEIHRDSASDAGTGILLTTISSLGTRQYWAVRGDGYSDFAPYAHYGRVYMNGAWGPTAANTWYAVYFDTLDYCQDTSRWSSGQYNVPTTGYYHINACWTVGASVSPSVFMVAIAISGTITRQNTYIFPSGLAANSCSISCTVYATAGQYFTFYAGNANGGFSKSNLGYTWENNFMEVWRVG